MTGPGRVGRALAGAMLWVALTALAPPPEAWSIDRAGSTIDLSVRSFAGVHTGRFEDWTGDILVDPDAPERSRATVTVRVRSLRMQPGSATERALGPGFLDAARYPVIRFQLRALQPEGGGRYTARADLTARGVTRPVSFPMDLRTEGARAQMTGGFAFDRADFGIGTSGVWNGLIDRQVTVRVALQARRA